jgi:hypothetical protein
MVLSQLPSSFRNKRQIRFKFIDNRKSFNPAILMRLKNSLLFIKMRIHCVKVIAPFQDKDTLQLLRRCNVSMVETIIARCVSKFEQYTVNDRITAK